MSSEIERRRRVLHYVVHIVRCLLSALTQIRVTHTDATTFTAVRLRCCCAANGDPVSLHVSGGQWTELSCWDVFYLTFSRGGGEGGRLCALNFGFVFISCVIFVSLQYKKEKQKTTSTPTKWRLLLAKKLWKQAKCNEMKKKVFRNGHQLYSKFFFFGLVWFFPKSESMQRLLRDF